MELFRSLVKAAGFENREKGPEIQEFKIDAHNASIA